MIFLRSIENPFDRKKVFEHFVNTVDKVKKTWYNIQGLYQAYNYWGIV